MRKKISSTIFAVIISATTLANFSLAMAQSSPAKPATSSATAAPSAQAPAQTSARDGFSLSPANGQATVRTFTFVIKAGETQSAKAIVKNFSSETVHFYLYGADPTLSNTGSLAYETRDQSGNGPGAWIKFASPEIDLAPDEERTVDFTVTIPAGTKPGEYRAGITMEKNKPATNNPGITIATRVVNHAKITVTDLAGNLPESETAKNTIASSTTPSESTPGWQTYYFWISFGLFIVSLALLAWTIFYGKKDKSRHPAENSASHRATHKSNGHKSDEHKGHNGTNHGQK